MSKNRTSTHRGKVGNAKHNEHRFYEDDKREVSGFVYYGEEGMSLEESELDFYKRYTQQLNEQNEKYLQQRQYKRVKSLEDFYNSKRYKPTEEILQYGHAGGDVPDRDTYEKMTKEYARRKNEWSKQHGNHLHVLDYVNHYDEATPHTHLREIWDYADDEGILRVSQEEAMKRAGLDLPDPSKPEGRYNNRSMTYTKMCREMWQDICEQYGYEVERVPLENGRKKGETVAQYHARKGRELEAKEQELDEYDNSITTEFLDIVGDITGYKYDPEQITIDDVKNDLCTFRDSLLEREERADDMLKRAESLFSKGQAYRDEAKAYYHQEQEWLGAEAKKHIQDENRKDEQKKQQADAERERIRKMQEQRKKDKENEARINETMAKWGHLVEQTEDDTQYQ